MKPGKILAIVLAMLLAAALSACGRQAAAEDTTPYTLTVFAPDNCMEIMSCAAQKYLDYAPNVTVKVTMDGGPVLAAQIEAGYRCDVFIADADMELDWLDKNAPKEANPNRNNIIDSATRTELFTGPVDTEYFDGDFAIYSAAVIKRSAAPAEAEKFINFLKSDIMEEDYNFYGFELIKAE